MHANAGDVRECMRTYNQELASLLHPVKSVARWVRHARFGQTRYERVGCSTAIVSGVNAMGSDEHLAAFGEAANTAGAAPPVLPCRKDGDRSMKKKDHPLVASQCLWRRRFAPPNSGCLAAARGQNFVCSHAECLGRCRCTGLVRGHADGFKGHVARGEAMGISADRHVRGEV